LRSYSKIPPQGFYASLDILDARIEGSEFKHVGAQSIFISKAFYLRAWPGYSDRHKLQATSHK
jgi:hypothetical protein